MAKKKAAAAEPLPMTRREFLYYVWGASMALFMAQMGGAIVWFALPRFKEGEFGGTFSVPVGSLPAPDAAPQDNPGGRFWITNVGPGRVNEERWFSKVGVEEFRSPNEGIKVLYKICVHLGCLYSWVDANDRFECPCHGSKYTADGVTINGPANRNLDAFSYRFVDGAGNVLAEMETDEAGNVLPLPIPDGAAELLIDTGNQIRGLTNNPGNDPTT